MSTQILPTRTNREKVQDLLKTITAAAQDAMNVYDSAGYDLAMRVLETACEELCVTLADPAHSIGRRMVMGFEPACLNVVSGANVADILSSFPDGVHVGEISKRTGLEESKLARIMRLLVSRRSSGADVFANNRLSQNMLSTNPVSATVGLSTDDVGIAIAALRDALCNPEYASTRDPGKSPFMYAVRNEITNSKNGLFDWHDLHPERQKRFGLSMIGLSVVTGALAVLNSPIWEGLGDNSSVCDVGAGVGSFAIELAQERPHLKITLCDLPVFWAKEYPQAVEEGRVEFLPADIFKEVPEGRDVYYARHIIHVWDDPGALIILKNMRKAMRRDSKLLIHEFVCPSPCSGGRDLLPASTNVPQNISIPSPGTKFSVQHGYDDARRAQFEERTLADYINLGAMAGLELREMTDFGELHLLEFRVADADLE
ncbi:S-adenosyl-L-methionine-dependent methyltransferase [Infundibulicybe gibba]|nr:S-adenosyl-L-methionine-dependent methyltransferase [Infundibulicybe gibba]